MFGWNWNTSELFTIILNFFVHPKMSEWVSVSISNYISLRRNEVCFRVIDAIFIYLWFIYITNIIYLYNTCKLCFKDDEMLVLYREIILSVFQLEPKIRCFWGLKSVYIIWYKRFIINMLCDNSRKLWRHLLLLFWWSFFEVLG